MPTGVRDLHAGNLHLPVACRHALGRHACVPAVDQLDQHVALKAVRHQDRRGAAIRRCGEQFERAAALGAAARVLCHFRHALDVSSAYEIGESSWGRRRRDGPTVLVLRLNLLLLLDHWLDFFGYRRRGEILPQRSGNMDLVARSEDGDRLIGFRARLKNGRYNVSTAYVLDPGQLERMKADAARAGATVLELSSRDHRTGQGRKEQDKPTGDSAHLLASTASATSRPKKRWWGSLGIGSTLPAQDSKMAQMEMQLRSALCRAYVGRRRCGRIPFSISHCAVAGVAVPQQCHRCHGVNGGLSDMT
jgi:hypothetical protein